MTEKRFEIKKGYYTEHIIENNHPRIPQLFVSTQEVVDRLNELYEENEQLKSFKNDVHDLIDELIKKAEKDVDDLRKDAYEKGYAYNPYYYWGVAHGLEKLKKELKSE